MTRRDSIRSVVFTAVGILIGRFESVQAAPGTLVIDLDQWQTITFKHRGKTLAVSMSEAFEALHPRA